MQTTSHLVQDQVSLTVGDSELTLFVGPFAGLANQSLICRYGDTQVLVTVTMSKDAREGIDFFPLVVNFEERMYAAGKIPGGFIKKEGRPSEQSILTSRAIDRPIRPLFPDGMRNEVQIVVLTQCADQKNPPDIPAMRSRTDTSSCPTYSTSWRVMSSNCSPRTAVSTLTWTCSLIPATRSRLSLIL